MLRLFSIYFSRKITEWADNGPVGSALLLGLASLFTVGAEQLFYPPPKNECEAFLQQWATVCQMNICVDCSSALHGDVIVQLSHRLTPLVSEGHNKELIGSFCFEAT